MMQCPGKAAVGHFRSFPGKMRTVKMPQNLPFQHANLYSHFRSEITIPGITGNVLLAYSVVQAMLLKLIHSACSAIYKREKPRRGGVLYKQN